MLTRKVYTIMDKKRLFIVNTNTKEQKVLMRVSKPLSGPHTFKVLTYDTEGRAKSGLKSNFHDLEKMLDHYPELFTDPPKDWRQRAAWINSILIKQLEIVECNLTVEWNGKA
jgi:hypothetical protein